jgi:multidrug efflux pump subunit AcrA (membrane-fusion protein)
VRPSERGFLGYVVEGDTARERVLTLGLRTADGRVEIKDGVKPGERIVVRGGEALKDGATVRVEAKKSNGGEEAAPQPTSHP